jgi:hypothetical protein
VDVAGSLLKRHRSYRQHVIDVFDTNKRFPVLYWMRPKRGAFVDSNRCTSIEGAFSLWVEYCEFFEQLRGTLETPVLDIKYEAFLEDPRDGLEALARFCGMTPAASQVQAFVNSVAKERSYAFRQVPQLVEFAASRSDDLARFGYDQAIA